MNEVVYFIKSINIQKSAVTEYEEFNKRGNTTENLNEYLEYIKLLYNSTVQFNAVIISIYACFENYIDDLFKCYIDFQYENITQFEDLPKKMKYKYIKKAGEYLNSPNRFNGDNLSLEIVTDTLIKNMSSDKSIKLIDKLILNHSGNLRIEQICELFDDVGIKNAKSIIKRSLVFKKYVAHKYNISINNVSSYLETTINFNPFNDLDKLVNARNNVAHGWSEDDRIAYDTILNEIIPFIRIICNVFCEIITWKAYSLLEENNKLCQFDKPLEVFDNNILCINSKNSYLQTGKYLYYKKSDGGTYVARIIEIQINNIPYEKIEQKNINIGIKLDRKIKKEYSFFYINHQAI